MVQAAVLQVPNAGSAMVQAEKTPPAAVPAPTAESILRPNVSSAAATDTSGDKKLLLPGVAELTVLQRTGFFLQHAGDPAVFHKKYFRFIQIRIIAPYLLGTSGIFKHGTVDGLNAGRSLSGEPEVKNLLANTGDVK